MKEKDKISFNKFSRKCSFHAQNEVTKVCFCVKRIGHRNKNCNIYNCIYRNKFYRGEMK